MSRNNPIPVALRPAFFGHMEAHDDDDLPDGAWFANLESAAERFMQKHKLTGKWQDPNSAVHQWLRSKEQ